LATFFSFVSVGSIPLVPYVLSTIFGIWDGKQFFISAIFTSIGFIIIGQIRGRITNTNKFHAAVETLFIGGVAATVAYFVGSFLDKLV
jgi:VIT1/CCC1 family predicted Fe2+/Mn2+ transporter